MLTPSTRKLITLLPHLRSLYTTLPLLQKGPPTTQGHASIDGKSGLDVQSHQVQGGKATKATAGGSQDGNDQPFDAAAQGSEGGAAKGDGMHKGPWKSQVGGQDDPTKGKGVKMGEKEEVAAQGKVGETVEMVKGLFGARKFSTYSRVSYPTTTTTASEKSSKASPETDQNPHLKHSKSGSDGVSSTGNASPNPSLPSHNSSSSTTSTSSNTKRSLSTTPSTNFPSDPTGTANSQGNAATLPMDKQSSSPLGEKGGHAGTPQASSDATPASKDIPTGTNAPDPEIPQAESEAASKGMLSGGAKAVRRYSTYTPSSRPRTFSTTSVSAFPSDSTGTANSQGDAATLPMDKQSSSPLGEKGGNAGTPQAHSGATAASKDIPTGTNAPDPGVSQKDSEAASKGMLSGGDKAVRRYSTVARRGLGMAGLGLGLGSGMRGYAANPPGGYKKAHKGEGEDAGYHSPQEALPPTLDSAYPSHDPKAAPPLEGDLKPSSEIPHSSTAVLPPNPVLAQQAKEGTLGDMNQAPDAKVGEHGLDEAWKHRK